MKLENKFFNSFFFPFLISVILSTLVLIIFLVIFKTNNNGIISLRKKYSQITIKSANVLLSTTFQKVQSSLNEHILYYQKIANKLLESNEYRELNDTQMKCSLTTDIMQCFYYYEESEYLALWSLDKETTEYDLDNNINAKNQLISFSKIIPNIQANLETIGSLTYGFTFYFENNELFISYPIKNLCDSEIFFQIVSVPYSYSNRQCVDENGEYYTVYKYKCEIFFENFEKSRTGLFDNNYLDNENKTIFISNFYEGYSELADRKFTMCIQFEDPITKGRGYSCSDYHTDEIITSLENINSKIIGYFFITIVGFNNVFYFPNGPINPLGITESIFSWDKCFDLTEKTYFYNNIKNIFSSNYINYMRGNLFDEVYVNGNNPDSQFFYLNGEKFKYSIYPILLENLNGKFEHVFSIVYVYNDQLFLNGVENISSSIVIKIILELLILIIFGSGLLYLIYLTFNTLSKHIVIPIKNAIYMLKEINIGGKKRLDFINFLKKRQEENLEKLEKFYLIEEENKISKNKLIQDTDSDLENNYNSQYHDDSRLTDKLKNNEKNKKNINKYTEFHKKYDEGSKYIEKEFCFYDFNEQLLQYRSLEISPLIKLLLDLKSSIILTSEDREKDQIINYSYSGEIFGNFKNTEGAKICQSNLGNLQSQLFQFDKAIYHLALSLQDEQLNKFLKRNLTDELDEDDFLLNTISSMFNKEKKITKNNILVEKQLNNSKDNFSQKNIGILINTRYSRLINVYYMFFKNIQKLHKRNDHISKGQFMNTVFHTITYYHKVIIQFIFLSYAKNDLIKIGESILDYIEFLIKFKFKTSLDDRNFLKINNKGQTIYKEKQNFKKKIFKKIINWFNLFDDYLYYIKDNSSLEDDNIIINAYSKNLSNENNELYLKSQSAFMYRINIQKLEFLKGKFCLYCKNYIDALYYFIHSSKKNCIIIDGLIKKKSLKHIYKILIKLEKKYEEFMLKNANIEIKMKEFQRDKNKKGSKRRKITNRLEQGKNINEKTFGDEIANIKKDIVQDIEEFNIKKEKDVLILIDFNIYRKNKDDDVFTKTYKLDSFIEQTITILKDYLSTSDRFCAIIFYNEFKIICPLMDISKIDFNFLYQELNNSKNNIFKEKNNEDENKEKLIEFKDNLFGFNLNNKISESSNDDSSDLNDIEEKNYNKLNGLITTINYLNNYSKIKEGIKNEKYIILFTDILNINLENDEKIEKIHQDLKGDKEATFLLVGKNLKLDEEDIIIENLILNKFAKNSEIIEFENMKKIKTILSKNKVIRDEIIHPNEIYK